MIIARLSMMTLMLHAATPIVQCHTHDNHAINVAMQSDTCPEELSQLSHDTAKISQMLENLRHITVYYTSPLG